MYTVCVLAQLLQSCPTLYDPMDCDLPGSFVHEILQSRKLELVAMLSSRASSQPRDRTCTSYVSCSSSSFHTTSATWEAQHVHTAAAAKSRQSCPTLRPQRRQPARLPCPWDSPGKNTGVGCHFLLQCMKVKSKSEVAHVDATLLDPWTGADQSPLSTGFSTQEYWSGVPSPSLELTIYVYI